MAGLSSFPDPDPDPSPTDQTINFTRGWPATTLLPTSLLQLASQRALSSPSITISGLPYGPNAGPPSVRASLATFLTRYYTPLVPTTANHLVLTGGASQTLGKILQVFSDPAFTRKVWMVAPTYFLACEIFEDAGFAGRLRAVREDKHGVDVQEFERLLEEDEMEGRKEEGGWRDDPVW